MKLNAELERSQAHSTILFQIIFTSANHSILPQLEMPFKIENTENIFFPNFLVPI